MSVAISEVYDASTEYDLSIPVEQSYPLSDVGCGCGMSGLGKADEKKEEKAAPKSDGFFAKHKGKVAAGGALLIVGGIFLFLKRRGR